MPITRLAVPALFATLAATGAAGAQTPTELVVNIPAGRLEVFQGGVRVRSYPVSVGTAGHATPTGQAALRRLVWNPTWTPPAEPWARGQKPARPGWSNPMGRVKIHLFRDYYIHGTPAANERRLGQPASHGCIRMRNADVMELARLVLRADGSPVSDATLDGLERNPAATRELAMRGNVRVRIEYRLAEVQRDSVLLHPDVYARAAGRYPARVREELRLAGVDAAALAEGPGRAAPAATVRLARLPLPERRPHTVLAGFGAAAQPAQRMAAAGM